jgi:hypothetical protein
MDTGKLPVAPTMDEVAATVKCVECGEPAVKGEPGSRRGPVYSWQDKPSGMCAPRCVLCYDAIAAGKLGTVIPGSKIVEWYATIRLSAESNAAKQAAEARHDYAAAAGALRLIEQAHEKRQEIIRAWLDATS